MVGGEFGGESRTSSSAISLSSVVQTATGTARCNAATAVRSAGSMSVVGSTWEVVLPMETVTVRAVALEQAAAVEVLEALDAAWLVASNELRRRC